MKITHALVLALALPVLSQSLRAADGEGFASPQDAVNALVTAAENGDTNAMHAIFGPEGRQLVSPDAVQAATAYKTFAQRLKEKTEIVNASDTTASLQIGNDAW